MHVVVGSNHSCCFIINGWKTLNLFFDYLFVSIITIEVIFSFAWLANSSVVKVKLDVIWQLFRMLSYRQPYSTRLMQLRAIMTSGYFAIP